jgi:hypothetical protein
MDAKRKVIPKSIIYSRKEKHDNSKRNKRKNRTEKSA